VAIVRVQQGGVTADNATSVARAYGSNVTADNLLIAVAFKYSPTTDAFAAGDLTKTAGTATIGTPTLDASINFNHFEGNFLAVGIWSVPVTGTGSCTLTAGGGLAGSYWGFGTAERSGLDISATRVAATNTGTGATGAPATGNASSTANALFVGGLASNASTNTAHTQDAAFSLIFESEDGTAHMTGSSIDQISVGALTDAASWTAPTTVQWAAAVAVYKEAGTGGATTILRQMMAHHGG
jgi:hypothetical protein